MSPGVIDSMMSPSVLPLSSGLSSTNEKLWSLRSHSLGGDE